jgi:hypothetical protein
MPFSLYLHAYALQATSSPCALLRFCTAGMLVAIAGNVMKQNAISPPPRDASMATEEESGRAGRNFIRGALLGIGATVLGVLLGGAPDYLAGTVKLPAILTEPGLLVSVSGWVSVCEHDCSGTAAALPKPVDCQCCRRQPTGFGARLDGVVNHQ